jgi:hypothetical protein
MSPDAPQQRSHLSEYALRRHPSVNAGDITLAFNSQCLAFREQVF